MSSRIFLGQGYRGVGLFSFLHPLFFSFFQIFLQFYRILAYIQNRPVFDVFGEVPKSLTEGYKGVSPRPLKDNPKSNRITPTQ